MTTVDLTSTALAKIRTDALVLATSASKDGTSAVLGTEGLTKQLRAAIDDAARVLTVTGALDEVVKIPAPAGLGATVLVLTGTGVADSDALSAETLRRAAGSATRQLAGTRSVTLALPTAMLTSATGVGEPA